MYIVSYSSTEEPAEACASLEEDSYYIINGTKQWVVNADLAELFVTVADVKCINKQVFYVQSSSGSEGTE